MQHDFYLEFEDDTSLEPNKPVFDPHFLAETEIDRMTVDELDDYIETLFRIHNKIVESDPRYHTVAGLSVWHEGEVSDELKQLKTLWNMHFNYVKAVLAIKTNYV